MSISRLVFPSLNWSELWHILSFLDNRDIYLLGCTCRSAFITFLREKELRRGIYYSIKHPPCFLGRNIDHDKVLLVSYPRCGNSYTRKLLEAATGIVTGSDSRPNRPLSASLIRFGYIGEGITDQSVWVVKSHFPERMGFIRFPVQRIVLVIRNPFDAIESYFHMGMTNTHDKSLTKESFSTLNDIWKGFVPNEADVWTRFYEYWLARASRIPILIIRYEDVLSNELEAVESIVNFMCVGNSPQSHRWKHFWERYRENKLRSKSCDSEQGPGYKPKQRMVGKSLLHALSVAQAEKIRDRTLPLLQFFGYELSENSQCVDSANEDPENDRACTKYSVRVHSHRVREEVFKFQDTEGVSQNSLTINDAAEIRSESDNFGRKITDIRRLYTVNDTRPFETN